MSAGDESARPEVRVVLDEGQRARRTRELWIAVGICDALLVVVVLVGLAAGWPWWTVVLAALIPLGIGAAALRAAMVIRRGATQRGVSDA